MKKRVKVGKKKGTFKGKFNLTPSGTRKGNKSYDVLGVEQTRKRKVPSGEGGAHRQLLSIQLGCGGSRSQGK